MYSVHLAELEPHAVEPLNHEYPMAPNKETRHICIYAPDFSFLGQTNVANLLVTAYTSMTDLNNQRLDTQL